jgi:hypothetical protein
LERFVDHVLTKDDVWITTRRAIANHWKGLYPPPSE